MCTPSQRAAGWCWAAWAAQITELSWTRRIKHPYKMVGHGDIMEDVVLGDLRDEPGPGVILAVVQEIRRRRQATAGRR